MWSRCRNKSTVQCWLANPIFAWCGRSLEPRMKQWFPFCKTSRQSCSWLKYMQCQFILRTHFGCLLSGLWEGYQVPWYEMHGTYVCGDILLIVLGASVLETLSELQCWLWTFSSLLLWALPHPQPFPSWGGAQAGWLCCQFLFSRHSLVVTREW